jgi:hypothetical protein
MVHPLVMIDRVREVDVPSVPEPLAGPYHVAPPMDQPESFRWWSTDATDERRTQQARATNATMDGRSLAANAMSPPIVCIEQQRGRGLHCARPWICVYNLPSVYFIGSCNLWLAGRRHSGTKERLNSFCFYLSGSVPARGKDECGI